MLVHQRYHVIGVMLMLVLQASSGEAQQYDLVADGLGLSSKATLRNNQLIVEGADGSVTCTLAWRDTIRLIGNGWRIKGREANQILRWPQSHSGSMQIGTLEGRSIVYRTSQMKIRGGAPSRELRKPPFPAPNDPNPQVGELLTRLAVSKLFETVSRRGPSGGLDSQLLRIATTDVRGTPGLLSRSSNGGIGVSSSGTIGTDWFVSPVGNGYVRLQTYQRGNVYALGTSNRRGLQLLPASQDPHQLWRVGRGRDANQFYLENLAYPGTCLTHTAVGGLVLQPITFAAAQMWSPYTVSQAAAFQPFWRTVNTEIIPEFATTASEAGPHQLTPVRACRSTWRCSAREWL